MIRLTATVLLALVCMAFPARAQPVEFLSLRLDVPDDMSRFDGGPRPDGPFLRYKKGETTDPQSELLEAIASPISDLEGRLTAANFAEFSLRPATTFCGEHTVLRNATRQVGDMTFIDVGYLCLRHSRSPEYSRQIVRIVGVFTDDQFISFLFVRRWRTGVQPDDALSPEQWMQPTDAFAASIEPIMTPPPSH